MGSLGFSAKTDTLMDGEGDVGPCGGAQVSKHTDNTPVVPSLLSIWS